MKPVLQALLLADKVYEEKGTGKKVIAGTFNRVWFKKGGALPREVQREGGATRLVVPGGVHIGSPHVYISLTEVRGTVEFVLRYVDLAQDQPLLQAEFQVKCDDPLQTVEVVLPLPPLPHRAGTHALELLCENELLGAYRVIVEELKDDDANTTN